MTDRPVLNINVGADTFKDYYFLKEELVDFCKKHNLSPSGGKIELTKRIAHFLDTGEKLSPKPTREKTPQDIGIITEDKLIPANFICSEKNRAFFKQAIGKTFSFNILFQNWLQTNIDKTYSNAITAYYQILDEKKKTKTVISKQYEYNRYIRDFFDGTREKSLNDAIKCWKYKKSLRGDNRFDKSDLIILT